MQVYWAYLLKTRILPFFLCYPALLSSLTAVKWTFMKSLIFIWLNKMFESLYTDFFFF